MTIGELKAAIGSLDDALEIVVSAPVIDPDGTTEEQWFELLGATRKMNPDTAEPYARLACAYFP